MTMRSCGPRNGDYLQLANQFARVTITRDTSYDDGPYVLTGDLIDPRAQEKTFKTWGEALAYALDSLAHYESGRAD